MVGTLILAERFWSMAGPRSIGVTFPTESPASAYASLLEFHEVLLDIARDVTHPPGVGDPDAKQIIPVTRFTTSDEVELIANSMAQKFQTEQVGPSFLLQPCHVVFSELADNVLHHSETKRGLVAASSGTYLRRDGTVQRIVEIAIGDAGIGIARAIMKNPHHQPSDDVAAIVLALKEGVSGVEDRYRGFGLWYLTQEVVRRARARVFALRSGRAYVRLRGDGTVKSKAYAQFPGTLAHVIIPYDAPSQQP